MNVSGMVKMVYTLLSSMNPMVSAALAVLTVSITVLHYFNAMWDRIFALIDTATIQSVPGLTLPALGLINGVFPLDTMMSYLTAYLALWVICSGIRMLKAFLPTLA